MAASTPGGRPGHRANLPRDAADVWYVRTAPGATAGRSHKRAARIAREIEADVIARGWPVGESLGSEQALQDRFGVSRSVLREAVRLVEHHQVARTRRGPNGGLFVTAPDAMPATRALVVYLEYIGATLDDLLEARLLLEPLAATLAAEHVTPAGAAKLRDILSAETHHALSAAAQRDDLHVTLGELSGNPVLHLFVDVLTRLTGRYADLSRISATSTIGPALVARTHREHVRLVDAVTAGDAVTARELCERHVEAAIAWLHEHHEPARNRAAVSRPDAPESQQGKLAERVGAAIRADIVAGGWRVGAVVGTELQLLERYGVSRSVLREAIRILEHHCVARMRRGPGGGLVVAAPEVQASVDTIALYLEYRTPKLVDLTAVRDAIELEHVTRVTKRRDDVAVQTFLADGQRDSRHDGTAHAAGAGMAEFHFHQALAGLAGNRVTELFLRILVELFRRRWVGMGNPPPEAAGSTEVQCAHRRILDAIADGDDVLARQHTRDHLDAVTSWWF